MTISTFRPALAILALAALPAAGAQAAAGAAPLSVIPAGYYGGNHVGVYIGGGYRPVHRRWRWRVKCHRHKVRVRRWNGHRWVYRWRHGRRHCHRVRVYY